jgi:cell fate (sporulation/competence/biofilm development) regulator YlbF (YheA/YmcA/DUF963 family)
MEIYEKADELAKTIHQCKEYQDLIAAGNELAKDAKTKKMVHDFLLLQAELAYAQSMGGTTKKKFDELNRMAPLIQSNQQAAAYLAKYKIWQDMVGKVYQIIQNSMVEGMSILD